MRARLLQRYSIHYIFKSQAGGHLWCSVWLSLYPRSLSPVLQVVIVWCPGSVAMARLAGETCSYALSYCLSFGPASDWQRCPRVAQRFPMCCLIITNCVFHLAYLMNSWKKITNIYSNSAHKIRLLTTKLWSFIFRIRFWPITASPIRAMSALEHEITRNSTN